MPRRYPDPPPPPQSTPPTWKRATPDVIFARRMQNTINRFRPRLYAYPVQFEPIHGGTYATEVTLECVDVRWFNTHGLGVSRAKFWKQHPKHPMSRVTLMLGPSIHRLDSGGINFRAEVLDTDINEIPNGLLEDRTWYMITLAQERPVRPPTALFEKLGANDDYEPAIELSILRIEDVYRSIGRELTDKYRIDGSGVQPQVMLDSPEVAFVGVLNVGQGGCNALYGTDGRPFLYYDFGRSVGSDSRPDSIKPCLASSPEIVLSNWDKDHHELGRSYPEARHLPWLCPEGPTGPNTAAFFRSLTHKRVWPDDRMKFEEYPWGFVLRSSDPGGNSNDSGLVLLVRVRDDSDAPPPGQRRALDTAGSRPEIFPDERYVLMTGDAMFQHIPSCEAHDLDGKIIGINAVHHGSYNGMAGFEDRIPLAAPPLDDHPAAVAFSYGFTRATGTHAGGYGHPMREAVDWYKLRGYYLRINTNAPPAGDPAHYAPQNVVLGWRRGNVPPPVDGAALAIQAARANFDAAVLVAEAARADCAATWILLGAAAVNKRVSAAQVVLDVNAAQLTPAYLALAISMPTQLAIIAAILQAGGRATGPLAYADIETLDSATYDAAILAADAAAVLATTLSAVIALNDPAYPAVQPVHCEGVAVPAVAHPGPWPVTDPPRTATTTVSAPAPNAPLRAITVRERQEPTLVLHRAHGLADGDQVTIGGSADVGTNALHAVTVVDADSYTIPHSRGGFPLTEEVDVSRAVVGGPALVGVSVADTGVPVTLVRHPEHAIQAGTNVTIAAATNVVFDGVRAGIRVDSDNYGMDVAGVPAGAAGVTAQASGTRSKEDFKELCDLADPGAAPTTVTHANHRLGSNAKVDIQRTTHRAHAGTRKITYVGVNTYTVNASLGTGFAENGVTVTGTRTLFAFANEPVEIVVGTALSTFTWVSHGLETGDYVTLTNGTDPVYAGVHRVTRVDDNRFQIDVGTHTGANYRADVSRHSGQFHNVSVILRDPGRATVVEDVGHGLNTGVTVTIAGTAHYDGAHVIQCVDTDHYAIAHVTGVNRTEHGNATATARTIPFAGEAVTTHDTGMDTRVSHPNHGLPTGSNVTIVGGAHAGPCVTSRIDANTYWIGDSTGATLVESGITGAGAAIEATENGGGGNTLVMHAGHNLATAVAVQGNVVIAGALHGALDGAHVLTYVDANHYTIPVALPAGYVERNQAVTVDGERAATAGEAPVTSRPTPSEEKIRDQEREQLTQGAADQKGRMVSAIAVRRQFEHHPASCTGSRCAFRRLHRH